MLVNNAVVYLVGLAYLMYDLSSILAPPGHRHDELPLGHAVLDRYWTTGCTWCPKTRSAQAFSARIDWRTITVWFFTPQAGSR